MECANQVAAFFHITLVVFVEMPEPTAVTSLLPLRRARVDTTKDAVRKLNRDHRPSRAALRQAVTATTTPCVTLKPLEPAGEQHVPKSSPFCPSFACL
jgi:hypothetical protein